jgi:hypothetical protein
MGVILSSSSAPREIHFSFDSYAILWGAYVFLVPIWLGGSFQPPKPESGE